MSFEDNEQFWEEFILYEEKPCLWDIKNKEYRNKLLKNAASESLVAKCKELFPNANKDFVMKKNCFSMIIIQPSNTTTEGC
jgi:hypothetical protein